MAPSLSQASRLISQLLSHPHRRGYAVVSDVSVRGGALDGIVNVNRSGMVGKAEEKGVAKNASSSAWAPDPVTGYYRPISHANEIDPVELRQMLLNHKGSRRSSPAPSLSSSP